MECDEMEYGNGFPEGGVQPRGGRGNSIKIRCAREWRQPLLNGPQSTGCCTVHSSIWQDFVYGFEILNKTWNHHMSFLVWGSTGVTSDCMSVYLKGRCYWWYLKNYTWISNQRNYFFLELLSMCCLVLLWVIAVVQEKGLGSFFDLPPLLWVWCESSQAFPSSFDE